MLKIYGSQLNALTLNKDGSYRKNTSLKINDRILEKRITQNVLKRIESKGVNITNDEKPIQTKQRIETKVDYDNKRARKYKVSVAGGIMLGGLVAKSSISVAEAVQKNDAAMFYKQMYSSLSNGLALGVGMFNPVLGVATSLINWVLSPIIQNTIQNHFDTQRLNYKFSNYDISKYSTYVYNNGQYIAQDSERVEKSFLGRKAIS